MKISDTSKEFIPHPEYQGQAVIVDVTELKKVTTQYGEREVFRVVFETQELNDKGQRWCVWSQGFTPSLHEKAGFRKFLKALFGRDLTEQERKEFDTESLIGMNAFLVISHTTDGDKTFANIASCTPWKGAGELMKPSSDYKRQKDRPKQDSTYHKTDVPKEVAEAAKTADPLATKVHVGKMAGHELRELDPGSVKKLIDLWLPAARVSRQSADDKRLIAALEHVISLQEAEAKKAADDEVPY